jgi:hypothetical protein
VVGLSLDREVADFAGFKGMYFIHVKFSLSAARQTVSLTPDPNRSKRGNVNAEFTSGQRRLFVPSKISEGVGAVVSAFRRGQPNLFTNESWEQVKEQAVGLVTEKMRVDSDRLEASWQQPSKEAQEWVEQVKNWGDQVLAEAEAAVLLTAVGKGVLLSSARLPGRLNQVVLAVGQAWGLSSKDPGYKRSRTLGSTVSGVRRGGGGVASSPVASGSSTNIDVPAEMVLSSLDELRNAGYWGYADGAGVGSAVGASSNWAGESSRTGSLQTGPPQAGQSWPPWLDPSLWDASSQ